MPDVSSVAPAVVRKFVAFHVHENSLVAGVLPSSGGTPNVERIENTERAVRRLIARLGGPAGLTVADEAGPGGFALYRLLSDLGVACDIVPPSLVAVRAGDRVKTDTRDAKKLVRLYRAGELVFVRPPSIEQEGLRIDAELEQIARTEPWSDPVRWLTAFRGISTRTALGLLAEIGEWKRFGRPRS